MPGPVRRSFGSGVDERRAGYIESETFAVMLQKIAFIVAHRSIRVLTVERERGDRESVRDRNAVIQGVRKKEIAVIVCHKGNLFHSKAGGTA